MCWPPSVLFLSIKAFKEDLCCNVITTACEMQSFMNTEQYVHLFVWVGEPFQMDRNNVNINSVSQGTRVLSLKDCRKIVKFSSDVFRLYHVYEIKTSGSAPKQTKKVRYKSKYSQGWVLHPTYCIVNMTLKILIFSMFT